MTGKEREYILWLCKRLINKYKEDSKIYDNVVSILDKDQKQLSFYKQTHNCIDEHISQSIDSLSKIRTSYQMSVSDSNEKYVAQKTVISTNELFENLDLNRLFSVDKSSS